jgi:CubicO group peptidase (beta-lactamase class C family)
VSLHEESPQAAPPAPGLADATAGQQERFAAAFRLIEEAIATRAFPGAALAVAHRGRLLAWRGFGRFTYESNSPQIRRDCLWDLASLTKPIATVSMAMLLYERGLLQLDAPVGRYLPEFAPASDAQFGWRRQVTVAMLLAHSAGLPAHRKLYLEASGRAAVYAAARAVPLEAEPGTRALYSDLGFLILGEALERIAQEPVDRFCRREVFSSLTLNMTFCPQAALWKEIPPTQESTEFRANRVQGEVHDDNAAAMGGVAPHAGLFGDALSVARFAECLLAGGAPLFRPETVRLFTTRQTAPSGTSRTLGWDSPSAPSQSGTLFSPRSFGHLGYTGTSLWCDPERHLSVTLLTNRTWPDASNQAIKQLRPQLHDAIVGDLP